MRKMSKSLLAMVLVIAMVMSLMPMSFAVEGEDAENNITITYDTRAALIAAGHVDKKNESKGRLAEYLTYGKNHGLFQYVSDFSGDNYSSSTAARLTAYNAFDFPEERWIIFEIYVPVGGAYTPKVNTLKKSTGVQLSLYVAPQNDSVSAASLFVEDYLVGTVDNNTDGGFIGASPYTADASNAQSFKKNGEDAVFPFNSSGYYNIGFKVPSDGDANAYENIIFANFHLVSGDGSGNALFGDMTISPESVKAGENAQATATAYKSNDGSLATLTYASLNEDVATVDPATGVITTKKAGKATITATAEGSANVLSRELTVTSADKSEITVEYDINGNADVGKTLKFAEYLTYDKTNDFFEYAKDSVGDEAPKKYRMRYNSSEHIEIYTGHWLILKINVPKAGEYDIKMKNLIHKEGQILNAYIFPTSVTPNLAALSDEHFIGSIDCNNSSGTSGLTTPNPFVKDGVEANYKFPTAGEYYIGFQSASAGVDTTEYAYVGNIILDGGDGEALVGGKISGVSDTLEIGDTATATASAYLSKTGVAAGNFTYSSDSSAITIDANTGALTANAEGEATITATSADALAGCNTITKTVTVKAAEPGEEVSDTMVNFTFVTSDAEAGSVSAEGYPIVGEVAIGTSVKATATANAGYEFAYWRNRAGTVLSTNATATFKFNTNTAVYAEFIELPDEDATEVPVYFYNGNGNLLESKNVTKGTLFKDAKIANPSMTGFSFMHWSDKDEEIAIADNTAINSIFRAVAIYGDSGEKYTVKADGSTVTSTATYGSEVTVTSSDANFVAWKLGDKVVSYDKAFTFYVWGDVELTSVTEGEEAPVAVLDEVDGNPMLIYSVPENCEIIEAGILFGQGAEIGSYESKAFAKESTGQFTAEPNGEEEDKTARGYLIFKKSGVIRVIYAD